MKFITQIAPEEAKRLRDADQRRKRGILEEGEGIAFSVALADSVRSSKPQHMTVRLPAADAFARMVHDLTHAYLGDAAPAFDEAAALAAARAATNAPQTPARAVTDAEVNAAYAQMVSDQVNAWRRPAGA